jgi:IstB-like ATP binding protein
MSLQTASIAQNCKALRLPAVGAQFASLAEEATQRKHSHLHYLEALLQAEMEDRERRSIVNATRTTSCGWWFAA